MLVVNAFTTNSVVGVNIDEQQSRYHLQPVWWSDGLHIGLDDRQNNIIRYMNIAATELEVFTNVDDFLLSDSIW